MCINRLGNLMLNLPDLFQKLSRRFVPVQRPCRIVMTLLVRNEADILPDWLDYHLAMGVDLILATDHSSVDETAEILRAHEKTGKVIYEYEPSEEYLQSKRVTRMAQRAFVEFQADWVINADADEFYVPKHGTLKTVLEQLPIDVDVISIKRNNMRPIENVVSVHLMSEMAYHERISLGWPKTHVLKDKVIHRGSPDVRVGTGAHSADSEHFRRQIACPEIYTLHYPLRSLDQFVKKITIAGPAHVAMARRQSRYTGWVEAEKSGQLESMYQTYVLQKEAIPELLAAGKIVEDRSVANVLNRLRAETPGL